MICWDNKQQPTIATNIKRGKYHDTTEKVRNKKKSYTNNQFMHGWMMENKNYIYNKICGTRHFLHFTPSNIIHKQKSTRAVFSVYDPSLRLIAMVKIMVEFT